VPYTRYGVKIDGSSNQSKEEVDYKIMILF